MSTSVLHVCGVCMLCDRLGGLRNANCVHNLPGVLLYISAAHDYPPSAANGFSSRCCHRAGESFVPVLSVVGESFVPVLSIAHLDVCLGQCWVSYFLKGTCYSYKLLHEKSNLLLLLVTFFQKELVTVTDTF